MPLEALSSVRPVEPSTLKRSTPSASPPDASRPSSEQGLLFEPSNPPSFLEHIPPEGSKQTQLGQAVILWTKLLSSPDNAHILIRNLLKDLLGARPKLKHCAKMIMQKAFTQAAEKIPDPALAVWVNDFSLNFRDLFPLSKKEFKRICARLSGPDLNQMQAQDIFQGKWEQKLLRQALKKIAPPKSPENSAVAQGAAAHTRDRVLDVLEKGSWIHRFRARVKALFSFPFSQTPEATPA